MSHATLAQAVQSAGWKALALDLAAVTDEQGFLERCASTLGLPPAAASTTRHRPSSWRSPEETDSTQFEQRQPAPAPHADP
ncbi:hypothetical protein ACFQLX_15205 [Streptomyces polyrhachis]|uniref:Uncharacterized protein n=1 Tax=Streptomyces polyrhachis TaxID=1282885 RepID=A0ABW2GFM4_9ACTN